MTARTAALLFFPLLSLPTSFAQTSSTPKRLLIELPVQFAVKRGHEVSQKLQVSVEPGYHVNSNKPKDEFLIPLKLVWTAGALQPGAVTYPKSEDVQVGSDQVSVFTGKFAIETQFKAAPDAQPGPALVTGKLSYQACNNQMCFRPTSTEIRLPVVIE